jgi:hypothetical protein
MKMLKLPNTEPLRKQNVYGSFGLDWLCSAEHFFAFEIGFELALFFINRRVRKEHGEI